MLKNPARNPLMEEWMEYVLQQPEDDRVGLMIPRHLWGRAAKANMNLTYRIQTGEL